MEGNNGKKAVKAGVWYTVANFVTKGAMFLTTPLFTRMMSKQDIGNYSNIASWVTLLTVLLSLDFAISLVVARFDYKEEFDKYISSTLIYGTIISLFFYLISILNMEWVSSFLSMPVYSIHLMFAYICVYPALLMYQYKCRYEYNYKGVIISSLGTLAISTLCALVLTFFSDDKLFGRTFGYYGPSIAICVIIYIYLLNKGRCVTLKYFTYAFKICFPMIWHVLAGHVLSAGDRIVITKYIGPEANAMYSIAYTCAMALLVLWSSMNTAWAPWATEQMHDGNISLMRKATYPYIGVFVFVSIYALLLGPELLLVFGGRGYVEARAVLPPVVVGYIFQMVYSLYVNAEFYLRKQTQIAIGTIIAAFLNIILNIIFVPKYGYVAAAYTTLFGYICLAMFHFLTVKKMEKASWFDNKFQWGIALGSLLLIPICLILYEYTIIRWILIGIFTIGFIAAMVKYRKKVLRLLKMLK